MEKININPYQLYQSGFLISPLLPQNRVEGFFKEFRRNYISLEMIRIGGSGDGGYLIPELLDQIDCCISPGVDVTANFEEQLANEFGIPCYLADASVEKPPVQNALFNFEKKYLGSENNQEIMTLGSWLRKIDLESSDSLLLQMDIEGAEYDVLTYESDETLKKFKCMVIEFHQVEKMLEPLMFRFFSALFFRLFKYFKICHVHPNNCCGIANYNGVNIPRVMEITFVRNDVISKLDVANEIEIPHWLDRKNVPTHSDIVLPDIWWKS